MFDRIIVSTDENPMFLQFVPIVSKAWQKYFPEKELSIAFVSNRDNEDALVKEMKKYGEVRIFNPVEDIPTANQAKIGRHILASEYGEEVCMIEDMDTIPLQRDFFSNRTSDYNEGVIVVGSEVYKNTLHEGKFPMSTMTAKGSVFGEIVNPNNLDYEDIIKSFIGVREFDHKEAIEVSPSTFSDESLMRVLLKRWNGKINKVDRDVDVYSDWIDRSFWRVDSEKLHSNGYITCNFLRPFVDNFERIKPIADYIFGEDVSVDDVILRERNNK